MNHPSVDDIGLLYLQDAQTLSPSERATMCCRLARRHEEAGDYEAARQALSPWWRRVGERPNLDGLSGRAVAEVVLRAGTLTGWIGSAKQFADAQEIAKDLLSESVRLFEGMRLGGKIAEARIELAYCYWREGAFPEARLLLEGVLAQIADIHSELKARAVLRLAIVECSANRLHEAFTLLTSSASLFEIIGNHAIKGGFHNELAMTLRNLGDTENRADYIDRALVEYAAASFHFEQAGHKRYCAYVENNLGFLYSTLNRFAEAHEHLDQARRLFSCLNDSGNVAQVDESRARAFIAEGRFADAERLTRSAVCTLEQGGERALLAEALMTHGVALARLNRHGEAQSALEQAIEVAELAGDLKGAGRAALTIVEELDDNLSAASLRDFYERADILLADSRHAETRERLLRVARRVLDIQARTAEADRLRALGTFASGVAHSINNPLAGIMGRAQLMLLTTKDETVKHGLEQIIKASEDGAQTIRHVQDFAGLRGSRGFASIAVDQLLLDAGREACSRWAQRGAGDLAVRIHLRTAASVSGDQAALREVLMHLIANAFDAMPMGGRLVLSAEEVDDFVVIAVRDTGTGINPEVRAQLFEPFFTTKGLNSMHRGLGLAASKGIITRHAGVIDAECGRECGTTLRVTLPRSGASMVREDSLIELSAAD